MDQKEGGTAGWLAHRLNQPGIWLQSTWLILSRAAGTELLLSSEPQFPHRRNGRN